MTFTKKTLAALLATVTLWCLLFSAPGIYRTWKEASAPSKEAFSPMLIKTKSHTWGGKDGDTAQVEWKIVASRISGLKKNEAEDQRKIFVSGCITNKQKKAIKVTHLSLQFMVEGVELYSHALAIPGYPPSLRIEPESSSTLHFSELVERDILHGLIYDEVDMSARIGFSTSDE